MNRFYYCFLRLCDDNMRMAKVDCLFKCRDVNNGWFNYIFLNYRLLWSRIFRLLWIKVNLHNYYNIFLHADKSFRSYCLCISARRFPVPFPLFFPGHTFHQSFGFRFLSSFISSYIPTSCMFVSCRVSWKWPWSFENDLEIIIMIVILIYFTWHF